MLDIARRSIAYFLETSENLSFSTNDPELLQKCGCFVTLYKKAGGLRGCIGTFERSKPLVDEVIRMSIAAATQDPRFPPVTKEELENICIEISILGELQKISGPHQIEIGKHGIYVVSGRRSGTYLPDVAVSQNWNAEEFLANCALEKAGISPQDLSRAELYRYEVEKIKE